MADTKVVRLDLDAYRILTRVKENLNKYKKKRNQSENATYSDAVRAFDADLRALGEGDEEGEK